MLQKQWNYSCQMTASSVAETTANLELVFFLYAACKFRKENTGVTFPPENPISDRQSVGTTGKY